MLYTAVGVSFGRAVEVATDRQFIFQRHIAHIKPKQLLVNSSYLTLILNTPECYAQAQKVARGAAQPTVSLGDLKQFRIPICALTEQVEIVRRVEALFKLADAIERRVASAAARTDKLSQSILARAFRGELVPTEAELARQEGRDYEPASALLERVRSGTEAPSQGELFPNPPRRGRRKRA